MVLRIRACAKCYVWTTWKFQPHQNITLRYKHVNHFFISTVSSLSSGAVLSVMLKAQNAGRYGGQKSVFVWSIMYSSYWDFDEKLSLGNKFDSHNVYLLSYFASCRNFHMKRKNNNNNSNKNILGSIKLEQLSFTW